MGIESTFVDMVDLDSIEHAFKDNTAVNIVYKPFSKFINVYSM